MKAVILAGGLGTRLSEATGAVPKPMVEIGGRPIIWHIMKLYTHFGINHFIICLGYRGYVIKEYFNNYALHMSDVTIDMAAGSMEVHQNSAEAWRVTLVDTGQSTMTGGRLKRVKSYVGNETFCMTYGDGLADINLGELISFHQKSNSLVTVTAVSPPGRFGVLNLDGSKVTGFSEKADNQETLINGGFFVIEPCALDYIDGDATSWEREPLERLAKAGHLSAYRHEGNWQAMDTLRDKNYLDDLWRSGEAFWKVWE